MGYTFRWGFAWWSWSLACWVVLHGGCGRARRLKLLLQKACSSCNDYKKQGIHCERLLVNSYCECDHQRKIMYKTRVEGTATDRDICCWWPHSKAVNSTYLIQCQELSLLQLHKKYEHEFVQQSYFFWFFLNDVNTCQADKLPSQYLADISCWCEHVFPWTRTVSALTAAFSCCNLASSSVFISSVTSSISSWPATCKHTGYLLLITDNSLTTDWLLTDRPLNDHSLTAHWPFADRSLNAFSVSRALTSPDIHLHWETGLDLIHIKILSF